MQKADETTDVLADNQPTTATESIRGQRPRSSSAAEDDFRIVIGVDEAGYGPNLGPMLVAATAWSIPKNLDENSFISAMQERFRTAAWNAQCQHVPLGDSKQLYSPAAGLRSLEAGLLAMLAQIDPLVIDRDFTYLLRQLDCYGPWSMASPQPIPPWLSELPQEMPAHMNHLEIQRLSRLALDCLEKLGIKLLSVRAAVVLESQFNQAVTQLGSKGRLLSQVTMQVVMELLSNYDRSNVEVFCDRQGGRKKYACVLLEAMPEEWFDTLQEQSTRSSYRRLRLPELTVHFSVGGDSFPPTALASMTAKYLRERLMASVNRFWQSHVADLQPTAGYPQDAKRFRTQIEGKAQELGLSTDQWWRVC